MSEKLSERHMKLALIWRRSNLSPVVIDCQLPSNAQRIRLELYQARRSYLNLPQELQDAATVEAMQLNCVTTLADPFSRSKCLLSLGRGSTDYLIESALKEIAKEDAANGPKVLAQPSKPLVMLTSPETAGEVARSRDVLEKFNVKAALEELGNLG